MPTLVQETNWGIDGGGNATAGAWDPFVPDRFLIGGDVWGVVSTDDAGVNWTKRLKGFYAKNQLNLAGLFFSRLTSGRVYALTTDGIMRSDDGGVTWFKLTGTVTFLGNGNVPGLTGNHIPRSNGHLMEEDPRDGILAVGTFSDGVWRSNDASGLGAAWTRVGLAGGNVRNVWLDPADPDTLWAALASGGGFGGLYKITGWKGGSPVVTHVTALPVTIVNKLQFSPADSNRMYATCHDQGVWRSTDHGVAWTQLGVGTGQALDDGTTQWAALGIRTIETVGDLRTATDVPYDATDPTNPQKFLDWFAPPTGDGYAIVIMLHGGGGVVGDKANIYAAPFSGNIPQAFARAGFVAVNANYTLAAGAPTSATKFPAGLQDIKTCLAWVKANAAAIHGDNTRIAIWGGSAGGTYSQLVGFGEYAPAKGDNFNTADITNINTRAGSLGGAAWSAPTANTPVVGTIGIVSNAMKYTGTRDASVRNSAAMFDCGHGDTLLRATMTVATTSHRSGPAFNATDGTQAPAHRLQLSYHKSSGSSFWRIQRKLASGASNLLLQVNADGVAAPVFANGTVVDVEVDRRSWPWILIRVKPHTSAAHLWQTVCHLNLANSAANTVDGTGVGVDLVTDGSLAAMAAGTWVGWQFTVSTAATDGDGTSTVDDFNSYEHTYLGITTILSASGYSDIRVGPPHSPLALHEQTMAGWFGTADQTGRGARWSPTNTGGGWFQRDPANTGVDYQGVAGTFDPAKPIQRSNLAMQMAGCSLFDTVSAQPYYDHDTGTAYNDWAIDPRVRTDAPPVHQWQSASEVCPLFQGQRLYDALNAAGRPHYDDDLIAYDAVAAPADTFHVFAGSNHADYPGVLAEYIAVLQRDLGQAATSQDIVIIGAGNVSQLPGESFRTMYRSADGGDTWACVTNPAKDHISRIIYGTATQWWQTTGFTIGYGDANIVGIYPDPNTPGRWIAVGGSGSFRSDDDGVSWAPAVHGQPSTSGPATTHDPAHPGHVFVADFDNDLWASRDNGATTTKIHGAGVYPNGLGNAHAIGFLPDGRFFLTGGGGTSSAPHTQGNVYSTADVWGRAFDDEGYWPAAGGSAGAAVRGLLATLDPTGHVVMVALTDGGGIWRGVRSPGTPGAVWTHLTGGAIPAGSFTGSGSTGNYGGCVGPNGLMFAHDLNAGKLLRSRDYGATWEVLWTTATIQPSFDTVKLSGDGTTLLVACTDGLRRIAGADQAGKTVDNAQLSATLAVAGTVSGVDVTAAGQAWTVQLPTGTTAVSPVTYAKVLSSTDNGVSWVDETNEGAQERIATLVSLTVTDDGWLLGTSTGGSPIRGQYFLPVRSSPTYYIGDLAEGEPYPTRTLDLTEGNPDGMWVIDDPGSPDHGTIVPTLSMAGLHYGSRTLEVMQRTLALFVEGSLDYSQFRDQVNDLARLLDREQGVLVFQPSDANEPEFWDYWPSNLAALIRGQERALFKALVLEQDVDGYPITLNVHPEIRRLTRANAAAKTLTNTKGQSFLRVPRAAMGSLDGLARMRVTPPEGVALAGFYCGFRSFTDADRQQDYEDNWIDVRPFQQAAVLGPHTTVIATGPGEGNTVLRQALQADWEVAWRVVITPNDGVTLEEFALRLRQCFQLRDGQPNALAYMAYGYAEADPVGHTDTLPQSTKIKLLSGRAVQSPQFPRLAADFGTISIVDGAPGLVLEMRAKAADDASVGDNIDWDLLKMLPASEMLGTVLDLSFLAGALPAGDPSTLNYPTTQDTVGLDGTSAPRAPGCRYAVGTTASYASSSRQYQGGCYGPWAGTDFGVGDQSTVPHVSLQTNSPTAKQVEVGRLAIVKAPTTGVTRLYAASLAVNAGDEVEPTDTHKKGRTYRATTTGTLGASEPPWPDVDGASILSGTVLLTETTVASMKLMSQPNQQYTTIGGALQWTSVAGELYRITWVQTHLGQPDGQIHATKLFSYSYDETLRPSVTPSAIGTASMVWDGYAMEYDRGPQAYADLGNGPARPLRATALPEFSPENTTVVFFFGIQPPPGSSSVDQEEPEIMGAEFANPYAVSIDVIPRDQPH